MPYNIPRNTKGEGRILYIFSTKALLYTFVGILIGAVIYFILKFIGLGIIGIGCIVIFGLIGFSISTFKVPRINGLAFTKNISGEYIDEVIKRFIKYKRKKYTKYALFTKEEKDEQ